MPGDETKEQHFVHRAYLEGFVDPTLKPVEFLWAYMPNKNPFKQAPFKIARRNYYYCHEEEGKRLFTGELGLSQLETIASPLLKRLRDRQFELTADERMTFAGYIATAHCRVPTFERRINSLYGFMEAKRLEFIIQNPGTLQRIAARLSAKGDKTTAEELKAKLTGGSVVITQNNRGWSVKKMFETMLFLQELIYHMNWSFLLAAEGDPGFLTTDNPVSVFDPSSRFAAFQSSPDAHFLFPISRAVCLLGTHHLQANQNASAYQVRQVNSLLIERSDTQVYAPFRAEGVQRLLNKHCASAHDTRIVLSKGVAKSEPVAKVKPNT